MNGPRTRPPVSCSTPDCDLDSATTGFVWGAWSSGSMEPVSAAPRPCSSPTLTTQPPLLQTYSRRSTLDAWGPERAQLGFPFRSAIEAGVVVSGGSDAPVATPNPLVGLDCLLTHRLDPGGTPLNPDQRLSLDQA